MRSSLVKRSCLGGSVTRWTVDSKESVWAMSVVEVAQEQGSDIMKGD